MIIIITIKQKQRNEIEGPNQKEEIKKKNLIVLLIKSL